MESQSFRLLESYITGIRIQFSRGRRDEYNGMPTSSSGRLYCLCRLLFEYCTVSVTEAGRVGY